MRPHTINKVREDAVDVARRDKRSSRAATLLVSLVVIFPIVVGSAQASAKTVTKKTSTLSVLTGPCTADQMSPSISSTIETDSSSSIVVYLQTSLKNISKKTCSIDVGPTSPSLEVDNPDGTVAWNNCYADDEPGACPLFLELKILKPKETYSWSSTWPPSSSTAALPTPGTYKFSASYGSGSSSVSTLFVLAN